MTAEVLSLRKVDWQTLSANFFVIFSPGPLDGAPFAYLATARVPPGADGALQERVAAAFPNVTAIPVRDVLERVTGVVDRIAVAVRLVALFVLGAGFTVMAEALAQSRTQRLYESVLLRTLGATRGRVARAFAVEYGCLGLVAGLGGAHDGRAGRVARRSASSSTCIPSLEAAPVGDRAPGHRRPRGGRGIPRDVPAPRPEAPARPPGRVARAGPPAPLGPGYDWPGSGTRPRRELPGSGIAPKEHR